jgi:putative MFS transporter
MVAAGALLAAVAGLLFSRITQHSNFALFTVIGAGVAIGNSLMSLSYHTYQSELFPTPMRARAVGFVYSFSRLSAIFSSYIIAATLDRAGSVGVFVLISMAMVVVALIVGLFGPRTRGLALEQI